VDFVEIYNVCDRKAVIEAAKRIINSDKMCRSYSDLNFGVTFFGTQCRQAGRNERDVFVAETTRAREMKCKKLIMQNVINDYMVRYITVHTETTTVASIFTVPLRMHTHDLAVDTCLSVCLSNAWIVATRNNLLPRFIYLIKDPFV